MTSKCSDTFGGSILGSAKLMGSTKLFVTELLDTINPSLFVGFFVKPGGFANKTLNSIE